MQIQYDESDQAGVPLSPLIDCVFLLLIFFLVTTMLKKWETQIPITMPDITTSLSDEANDDIFRIALDRAGNPYFESHRDRDGFTIYTSTPDLAAFLKTLASHRDQSRPLRLMAERDARFQSVVDALDTCQLQGFDNVDLKLNYRLRLSRDDQRNRRGR